MHRGTHGLPSHFRWICLSLSVCSQFSGGIVKAEAPTAVEQRLRDDVRYLASEELEGRGIGSRGLNLAAEHILKVYQQAGLKTDLVNGGAFQKFEMKTSPVLGTPNEMRITHSDGTAVPFQLDQDFVPTSFSSAGELRGEIVFCGYGIVSQEKKFDEFEGVDLKGKIALLMRRNPQQGNPHGPFQGMFGQITRHAELRTKLRNVLDRGAVGVILVDDPYTAREALKSAKKAAATASKSIIEEASTLVQIADTDLPSLIAAKKKLGERLTRRDQVERQVAKGESDALMDFGYGGQEPRPVPIVHITRKRCNQLLQKCVGKDLTQIEAEIDKTLKPQSALLAGWTLQAKINVEHRKAEVKNVIGSIPGTTDETVVIGAHYDHVGRGGENSLAPGSKEIHNGADDNASGTAGLLELVRQLAPYQGKLRRTILFIAFTGEENGLIGSAHYVQHPIVPLDKTVAMLNLDMVGRMSNNKLSVFGTKTSPIWEPLLSSLCAKHEFQLNSIPTGTGPSDQTSFYLKRIPVLHFFTGTHSDYHRPSDDWEKINVPSMRRVVELIASVAVEVANAPTRPEFVMVSAPEAKPKEGSRPYIGTIPDFSSDQPGYGIGGAAPGSPAEQGGLKSGDRIIKLGEHKVDNLEDFDAALRKFKAGETIEVTVVRDKQEIKLKVVAGPPRG